MIWLATDTTSQTGSLALFDGKNLLGERTWSRAGSHSEFITESLADLLSSLNKKTNQIERVAVGIGPGSFTGIRVGVNFARTIAYSLDVPVYQISSLKLLACQILGSEITQTQVLQYGFRDLFYVAEYKTGPTGLIEVEPPKAVTLTEWKSTFHSPKVVIGAGFQMVNESLSGQIRTLVLRDERFLDVPTAGLFRRTPAGDDGCGDLSSWSHVKPLYIRASEAEEKLRTGLLKPL